AGLSPSRCVIPATTQSAGEPPTTAKRRGLRSSNRHSRPKVKRCPAPDRLPSGATIQIPSEMALAISAMTARPGASTPSSLVMRMRSAMSAAADGGQAAQVRLQRLGDQNRAVFLLVVFQHGNEAATNG